MRKFYQVILVLLYSCGLRRNEAVHIDCSDILFEKQRLYVRKGKNYKERFVPINHYNLKLLEDYVFDARIDFKVASLSDYVFVSRRSTKISGCTIENDLKMIIKASNKEALQNKNITPHMLRHSIATHFLKAGMKIEDINGFAKRLNKIIAKAL